MSLPADPAADEQAVATGGLATRRGDGDPRPVVVPLAFRARAGGDPVPRPRRSCSRAKARSGTTRSRGRSPRRRESLPARSSPESRRSHRAPPPPPARFGRGLSGRRSNAGTTRRCRRSDGRPNGLHQDHSSKTCVLFPLKIRPRVNNLIAGRCLKQRRIGLGARDVEKPHRRHHANKTKARIAQLIRTARPPAPAMPRHR